MPGHDLCFATIDEDSQQTDISLEEREQGEITRGSERKQKHCQSLRSQ